MFIQKARRGGLDSGSSEASRQELCHVARLTLDAGYDYWVTVPTGRAPDIKAQEGEELITQTIQMFKGPAPPDDHHAMDAHLLGQGCP